MNKEKKILFLTNFRQDNQKSMIKFGEMLIQGFSSDCYHCTEIYPQAVFCKFRTSKRIFKWFSYIDKYIIFPRHLEKFLGLQNSSYNIFHIIDHSNSVYINKLKKKYRTKILVTCHDFIAIKSALKKIPESTKTSILGRNLQKWILNSIYSSDFFACDSMQTENDLINLVSRAEIKSKVIHLGTELSRNYDNQCSNNNQFFLSNKISVGNYILHVGSAAWYKNRKSVIASFIRLKKIEAFKNFQLVLVGPEPQDHELNSYTKKSLCKYSQDLIVLKDIPDHFLHLLYQKARALIFPSFIEGFGWPPLEAASLGCPVITTKCGAIYEILGNIGTYVDPHDQAKIDTAVINIIQREKQIKKLQVPSISSCLSKYSEFYGEILNN